MFKKLSDGNQDKQRLLRACADSEPVMVIQAMVAESPGLLEERNEADQTALHVACASQAHVSVIQYLIEQLTKVMRSVVVDIDGCTPLHLACAHGASLEVIQALVQAYPEACQARNFLAQAPLDIALDQQCSTPIVQCLMGPEVSQIGRLFGDLLSNRCTEAECLVRAWQAAKDSDETLLHLACRGDAGIELVNLLIDTWPQYVQAVAKDGCTIPLHIVCGRTPKSTDVLERLLQAWPESIRVVNREKGWFSHRTALYIATSSGANVKVLEILVKAWPEALEQRYVGLTLLHFVVAKAYPVSVIDLFCRVWPKVLLAVSDGSEMTALHLACRSKASLPVIQLLVDACPPSLCAIDHNGFTALHYALEAEQDEAVIELLIERFRSHPELDAFPFIDIIGHACRNKTPLPLLKSLVATWPQSIKALDSKGNTPLHLLCAQQTPLSTIEYMMKVQPDAVKTLNHANNSPLHVACWYRAPMPVVSLLVQAWPDACPCKNLNGQSPRDVAEAAGATELLHGGLLEFDGGSLGKTP